MKKACVFVRFRSNQKPELLCMSFILFSLFPSCILTEHNTQVTYLVGFLPFCAFTLPWQMLKVAMSLFTWLRLHTITNTAFLLCHFTCSHDIEVQISPVIPSFSWCLWDEVSLHTNSIYIMFTLSPRQLFPTVFCVVNCSPEAIFNFNKHSRIL